jgi:hypothetical protein
VPACVQTARGPYILSLVGEPERSNERVILTISMESGNGIERVAIRCALASTQVRSGQENAVIERIGVWIAAEFEKVREAALKSVRAEHKLLMIPIGPDWRGQL